MKILISVLSTIILLSGCGKSAQPTFHNNDGIAQPPPRTCYQVDYRYCHHDYILDCNACLIQFDDGRYGKRCYD
jgi:hypothetical protein